MSHLLTDEHRAIVRQLADRGPNAPIRRRAEILLLYDDGLKTREVSEQMSQTPHTVLRWRREYRRDGMGVFPERAFEAIAGAEEEVRDLFDPPSEEDVPDEAAVEEAPEEEESQAEAPDAGEEEKGEEPAPPAVVTQDGAPTLESLLALVHAAGPYSVIIVLQQAAQEKKKKKKKKKAPAAPKKARKKSSGKGDSKSRGKKKKKATKKKSSKKGKKKRKK